MNFKSDHDPVAASSRMVLFRRLEIKYLVDRTTRTALTKDLVAFMGSDKFSTNEDGYQVRSLYFDTPDCMAYSDKLAGLATRHKLRVRSYGEEPKKSPFFRLEVKSRYLSFINKITVDIPTENYPEIEPAIFRRILPPPYLMNDEEVSKEFFRLQRLYNMEPKIMVQYRRQAFERTEMNRIRVNFDDELQASRNLDLFGPLRGARSLLKYGNAIFEIKVDRTMPFWMHKLISKYNLQNQAFSKFCYSIRSEARFSTLARVFD